MFETSCTVASPSGAVDRSLLSLKQIQKWRLVLLLLFKANFLHNKTSAEYLKPFIY